MQPVKQDQTSAIGRRVAARRTLLGFTPETAAARAGMAAGYLEYVEEQGGRPSAAVMRRLAEALSTTVEHLYGEDSLEPELHLSRDHGDGPAHVVSRLSPSDCRLLLGSVPVGRVAFVVNGPPLVLPVNFTLMGNEIVIQTAAMSPLAALARAQRLVSFEADDIDERSRLGWSVLCHGPARISTEQGEQDHHAESLVRPWFGGDRRTVLVIAPTVITGRRIGLV